MNFQGTYFRQEPFQKVKNRLLYKVRVDTFYQGETYLKTQKVVTES